MSKPTRVLKDLVCKTCGNNYQHWHYSSKFCSKVCYHKDIYRKNRNKYLNKGYQLKKHYGISVEKYLSMYLEQKSKCYLCGESHDVLCVDHNHDTGEVRKLLCKKCNMALGLLKENTKTMKNMIKYIKDLKSVRGE